MAISANRVTRFGLSGSIASPAGSFLGKAASPPVFTGTIPDITATEGDANVITDLSTYFTGATSYSIAPALEAGWSFDTVTGILTVDTDATGTFGTYVVTGTNITGSTPSNAFNVIITADTAAGGIYNAAAFFPSGQTDVTITLYNPTTDSTPVPLDSNVCEEVGSTGLYMWDMTKVTTLPQPYKEYGYIMTDGVTSVGGVISYDNFFTQYLIHSNMI